MLKPFVGIFVKPVSFEASRDKNCHGNMKMPPKKLDHRPLNYLTRLVLTATIYANFMPDFEQTIQQSYHDHFLLQNLDMGKKNYYRDCLQRKNLSWKTTHWLGISNCRHFDAVCLYGNIMSVIVISFPTRLGPFLLVRKSRKRLGSCAVIFSCRCVTGFHWRISLCITTSRRTRPQYLSAFCQENFITKGVI